MKNVPAFSLGPAPAPDLDHVTRGGAQALAAHLQDLWRHCGWPEAPSWTEPTEHKGFFAIRSTAGPSWLRGVVDGDASTAA